MPLKVLTLNLWNNSGPYERRRPRLRHWIEQLNPDLIGFQEALRGDRLDQAADLLAGLGYQYEFVKAVDFWGDPGLEFGNVAASRWPIAGRETIRLPDAGDQEQRAAISITVESPFGAIVFTSTHLNWKLHHGWVRERQVIALSRFVRLQRPRGGFPPIVVGDFNAQPESTEIRYMTGLHALEGGSTHFYDAWRLGGEGDGTTWSNNNPYAAPGLEPDRRIDYIFVGPPGRDGVGQVLRSRVVANDQVDDVWPTDHFGVYAELRTEPLNA